MKNQPLLVSVIICIMVVFVIVGASLVAKLSNVNKLYKGESLRNMQLSKVNEDLKAKVSSLQGKNGKLENEKKALKEAVEGLKNEVIKHSVEIDKLKRANAIFKDKLKEELANHLPVAVQTTGQPEKGIKSMSK